MPQLIEPMHDRILVKFLDDPEYLDNRVIALVKNDGSLYHQAGRDPMGDLGDYRKVMRRARVVATGTGRIVKGKRVPVDVNTDQVIYCTGWDDAEGFFPGMALIQLKDVALVESGV